MTEQRDKEPSEKGPWAKSLSRAKGSLPAVEGSSPATVPVTGFPAPGSPRRQDPLHGVTLKMIVTRLEEHYGWEELGRRIPVNCFLHEPSIASSLKFLRRTPWAREKVEALYLQTTALHGKPGE